MLVAFFLSVSYRVSCNLRKKNLNDTVWSCGPGEIVRNKRYERRGLSRYDRVGRSINLSCILIERSAIPSAVRERMEKNNDLKKKENSLSPALTRVYVFPSSWPKKKSEDFSNARQSHQQSSIRSYIVGIYLLRWRFIIRTQSIPIPWSKDALRCSYRRRLSMNKVSQLPLNISQLPSMSEQPYELSKYFRLYQSPINL